MRAFIALCVPEAARAAARRYQERWRALWPRSGVSWTQDAAFHLTLRFLGDHLDPRAAAAIGERLGQLVAVPPIPCQFTGPLGFPNLRNPMVLALSVGGPPDLLNLAPDLDRALQGLHLERRDKPFRPHLTLGRIRDRAIEVPEPPDFGPPVPFMASRVVLFQSHLSPNGSRYEALGEVELSGRAAAGS